MRKNWAASLLMTAIVLCGVFDPGLCILSGYPETEDITQDPKFNCRWTGGQESRLHCSCLSRNEEFYIKQNSIPPYDLYAINITNCGRIRFGPKAIAGMRSLRLVDILNVESLVLEEESLYWIGYVKEGDHIADWDSSIPSLSITIRNTTIERITGQAIKGRINSIYFINVTVESISPFGFSSLQQLREIVFDGVVFRELPPQSFKKFTAERLVVRNSAFGTLSSRTFKDISVKQEFLLQNITVDTLRPAGFSIYNPRYFELSDSYINNFNGEGFKVITRGDVFIKNNVFNVTGIGAFRAITTNKEEVTTLQRIIFDKNVFHELSRDALVIDKESFVPEFNDLQVTQTCDCGNLERYFRNGEDTQELKCAIDEGEWVSVDEFRKISCSVLSSTTEAVVITLGVAVILVIFVAAGLACYFKKLYRCDSYSKQEKQGKVGMIVPDGRTYRETELHVIVERADLLTTDL